MACLGCGDERLHHLRTLANKGDARIVACEFPNDIRRIFGGGAEVVRL